MSRSILIVTPIYPPAVGGPAQYVEALVKKLPKDIQVKVIALTDEKSSDNSVVSINLRQGFLKRQWSIVKAVYSELAQADVLYVQGTLTVGLASMMACLFRNKPYVVKYVGDEVWEKYQSQGGKKTLDEYLCKGKNVLDILLLQLEKLVLSRADHVITPGNYLRNILNNCFNIIAVNIPNAVEFKQDIKIQKIPNSIIFIGRLVPWKQLDKVIEVFGKLQKDTNDAWSLTIVGDGSEKEKLEDQVKEQAIPNVRFMGKLSKGEALRILANHEYLVLYSTYEGMSHTLLDAMALKTKIIASDIDANHDLLAGGSYGKLVPLDSIQTLLSAFTERYDARMLDKARERVLRMYSWDNHITELLKVLLP